MNNRIAKPGNGIFILSVLEICKSGKQRAVFRCINNIVRPNPSEIIVLRFGKLFNIDFRQRIPYIIIIAIETLRQGNYVSVIVIGYRVGGFNLLLRIKKCLYRRGRNVGSVAAVNKVVEDYTAITQRLGICV